MALSFFMMYKLIFVLIGLLLTNVMLPNDPDTIFFNQERECKKQSFFSRDYSGDIFLGGNFESETNSFSLILHTSVFEEKKSYNLIIANHKDSVYVGNNISCARLSTVDYFEANNFRYEIIDYSLSDKYIVFKGCDPGASKIALYKNRIPSISFENLEKEKVNFTELKHQNKLIYIDFWGLWCPACLKEFPLLKKLYSENKESLTVVALNHGDKVDEIKFFLERENITWINGISTQKIERWFFLEGYPHGMLFDSTGNLIQMNCSLEQLEFYLINKQE